MALPTTTATLVLNPVTSPRRGPSIFAPCLPTNPISVSLAVTSANGWHAGRKSDFVPSVAFNPSGNFELSINAEADSPKVAPPLPPKEGRIEIVIDGNNIKRLDLSPVHAVVGNSSLIPVGGVTEVKRLLGSTVGFTIKYEREDPNDIRELSEFPDIRLWFVRLDALYPWFPVVLDWRAGELARYAAMLVPHQMSTQLGIVFNPEALELFVMKKVFTVYSWLKQQNFPSPKVKTRDMARMLGFGIGDELFDLIDTHSDLPLES